MPATPENALEGIDENLDSLILLNHEINATCSWTKACGSNCILANTNSGAGQPLPLPRMREIAEEFINGEFSRAIRHYCIAGKEPLGEMRDRDLVLELAQAWNETRTEQRCQRFGLITAAAGGVAAISPRLADHAPISWMVGSVDTNAPGLRTTSNNEPLLKAFVAGRSIGAFRSFGINTQLTRDNLDDVMAIGRQLARLDADQWTVGPLLFPDSVSKKMTPVLNLDHYRQFIDRVTADESLDQSRMSILLAMDLPTLRELVGDEGRTTRIKETWRYEYSIGDRIRLIALNGDPSRFARVRWDGEILTAEEFRTVGLRHGSRGVATGPRLRALLGQMAGASSGLSLDRKEV